MAKNSKRFYNNNNNYRIPVLACPYAQTDGQIENIMLLLPILWAMKGIKSRGKQK